MAITTLASKEVGSIIKLKENGSFVDFYVCKHDYESDLNGSGRTLVVRKDCCEKRAWHSSDVNAYATSTLDTWFNNTYKNLLDEDTKAAIGTTEFYYTPGNEDYTVSTLSRSVFALSTRELGYSGSDKCNNEGTYLPISGTLKIAYLNGSAVGQWTRTPATNTVIFAWFVNSGGTFSDYYCKSTLYCARPAFTLPGSLSISDDGSVTYNNPPTISGSSSSGSDLGEISEPFSFTYNVADADNDTVTVGEYLDSVLQRSYTASLGSTNTFEATYDEELFQKILNGSHTLEVIAADSVGNSSAAYTVTFNKQVRTAAISLSEPLPADDVIKAAVISVTGSIPQDASLKVLVTNNALDDEPVWEDMTQDYEKKINHVFANSTAANGFAFNFKVTVTRGASEEQGYISSIGGAFE